MGLGSVTPTRCALDTTNKKKKSLSKLKNKVFSGQSGKIIAFVYLAAKFKKDLLR